MGFVDKTILITGASSGIGAGAALHLAKLGAKIAMVGRDQDRLNNVAEQIKSSGSPTPLQILADVTTDAERIVNETVKHFGKIDVLVNSAGTLKLDILVHNPESTKYDSVQEFNLTDFDKLFTTNVRSVIGLTQLCIPYLEQTKGNVVNVSSIASFKTNPYILSNSIATAALDQFTKCSALDLSRKGIRVNSINHSVIRTPIYDKIGLSKEEVQKMYDGEKLKYPVGRVGEVQDTSAAIAYLANNDIASFVTGVLLPVDGGALINNL